MAALLTRDWVDLWWQVGFHCRSLFWQFFSDCLYTPGRCWLSVDIWSGHLDELWPCYSWRNDSKRDQTLKRSAVVPRIKMSELRGSGTGFLELEFCWSLPVSVYCSFDLSRGTTIPCRCYFGAAIAGWSQKSPMLCRSEMIDRASCLTRVEIFEMWYTWQDSWHQVTLLTVQELVRLLRVPCHSQARFTHDSSILNRAGNLFEDIVRFLQTPGRVVSHFSLVPPIARAIVGFLLPIVGGGRGCDLAEDVGPCWVSCWGPFLGALAGCHGRVPLYRSPLWSGHVQ